MVFGRKKKQEQDEAIMDAVLNATGETDAMDNPASPPTPKTKKSKSKTSGQSKSKPVSDNIVIVHAEKITLTLAILLSGYLIYAGFNSGMDDNGERFNKTADNLKTSTASAANKIESGDWNVEYGKIFPDNIVPPTYENRAKASQIKINPGDYKFKQFFNPPVNRSPKQREDPELYAPTDLHAVALTGPVAYLLTENEIDPTADDEPAQPKIEEKLPVKPRSSREDEGAAFGGFPGMDGGGMEGMPGMEGGDEGGMPGMNETNSNEPIRRLRGDRGQISGYRPIGGATMGGMDAGMGGMPGMDAGMGGMPGMDGGMDGMPGMGDSGGGSAMEDTGPKGTPVARARTMVAVTALVPFKKQFDEYERALAMRSGYDSYRDQPNYVFMYVERVDVTSDPTQVISEDQWQQNYLHTKMHRVEAKKWHGTANEIVDPTYLNTYISLSCPPVMLRDLENLLRHPDIPLVGQSNQDVTESETTQPDEEPEDQGEDGDLPGGAVTNNRPPQGNTTQPTPGGGDPSMPGMGGMGGMPGMGGMGGMPGMGGMGGMPGMGMDGSGGEVLSANIPDYKLVRFFDFGAEIGHTYRYRVQILVEDPNHPNTSPDDEYPDRRPPDNRTLEEDVLLRIKDLPERTFFRASSWSEPSDAVTVPEPLQFAGGSVDPKKFDRDSTGKTYQDTEPAGLVKTIDWDLRRAVNVQFDRPVHRGSILNFTADAEYGHPISEIIMAAPAYAFQTDYIVGDIRGGDELPLHTKDNPYYAPGEFLLIDPSGNLTVRSELDDTPLFRRYDYSPDAPVTGLNGTGGGTMGNMEGMGGMPGMEGGDEGGIPGF